MYILKLIGFKAEVNFITFFGQILNLNFLMSALLTQNNETPCMLYVFEYRKKSIKLLNTMFTKLAGYILKCTFRKIYGNV